MRPIGLLAVLAPILIAQQPLATLPYTPSLDLASMDRAVEPCQNFYMYACGNWIKSNPIPADQPRWDVYGKLTYDNQQYLWGLLLDAGKPGATRTANQQKIGDMFDSCMDEHQVNAAGAAPMRPLLDKIDALKSLRDLPAFIAEAHMSSSGDSMLFDFGASQDFSDSTRVIGFAGAGGLGLPDRDYYTKDDAKSVEIRKQYEAHVAAMLRLLGDSEADARTGAAVVLRLETALAKASLTRVEQRDPYKLFHKMSRAELQKITPSFQWDRYLRDIGAPGGGKVNVTQPAFYAELEKQFKATPLTELKTYLRWHAAHGKAPFLSPAFVDADFEFYGKTLRGTPAQRPRWKRCVQITDRMLGEALGQVFVEKTFTPDTKARTVAMTKEIETAMKEEIDALDWMSPATKKKALEKLHGIANKIGYPDKWRDYSALEIKRGDYFGNAERGVIFESRREIAKIGKPVDRGEWEMSAPTVNAYYNPQMNDINFPAGVLQPPLFDPKMDDAPNYGDTGATIGHEL
ncbi:MAG TPA: M13 family metallopeptidase, partial [Bryobacteraceae bacterium]|nr:M13 family metallopeptidase [Bryobacteraceae bacterium]